MKKETAKTDSPLKAEFTKFNDSSNWVDGVVGKYHFQAKLFDTPSTFGIENGRVSKLSIWDQKVRKEKLNFLKACVVNYDRGWDKKPNKKVTPYFDAVMTLLEAAPKRFENSEDSED